MGIYRKYDLTMYSHYKNTPVTPLDCDAYIVRCDDGYEYWERKYDCCDSSSIAWQSAANHANAIFQDEEQGMTRAVIEGLVYD